MLITIIRIPTRRRLKVARLVGVKVERLAAAQRAVAQPAVAVERLLLQPRNA